MRAVLTDILEAAMGRHFKQDDYSWVDLAKLALVPGAATVQGVRAACSTANGRHPLEDPAGVLYVSAPVVLDSYKVQLLTAGADALTRYL